MKMLTASLIASILLIFSGPAALAQDDLVEYLATECESDIELHGSDVAIGENRVLSCLADHDAELADSCKTALANTTSD